MQIHRIGYRMLFGIDAQSTTETEAAREARLRQEFVRAVPSADRLKGSELRLHRKHTTSGTELHFSLVELPTSRALPLEPAPSPGKRRSGESDRPFRDDVLRVTQECANVETRLTLAASPAVTVDQLRGPDPDPDPTGTRALRRLFQRRGRKLVLPSPTGGREITIPPRPRHFPVAQEVEITANILALILGQVRLGNASLAADALKNPEDPEQWRLPLPTSMQAHRAARLPDADVIRLVRAMDSQRRVRLKVRLSFDWADGRIAHHELVSCFEVSKPITPAASGKGSASARLASKR